ncbi:Uncharacterised protein [Legionella pneumophila]|nr:Uncharacterised protein [Legionella pneumophila]
MMVTVEAITVPMIAAANPPRVIAAIDRAIIAAIRIEDIIFSAIDFSGSLTIEIDLANMATNCKTPPTSGICR